VVSGLKVMASPCDQCLFSTARIVSAKRKADVLRKCAQNDSHFLCHTAEDTVCAGFVASGRTSQLLRIADRLGAIERAPPPGKAGAR
jgi:hypothetical protein